MEGVHTSATAAAAGIPPRLDADAERFQLSSLAEISRAASGAPTLKAAVRRVLDALNRHHDLVQSAVRLHHGEDDVAFEAPDGLDLAVARRVSDSVVARVLRTGRPAVMPLVITEALFLDRGVRRPDPPEYELSFICVPIVLHRKTVGSLAVVMRFKAGRDYESATAFFTAVASLLAQAIETDRRVEDERRRLEEENTILRQELRDRYEFSNIIGSSRPIKELCYRLADLARADSAVLVHGEPGAGKELVANTIHWNSPRNRKPFVKVNCATLPESLLESEVFGEERSGRSGSDARKKGRLELADGGTLFFDEIGDLGKALQAKVMRVLQYREFQRVGGTQTVVANVRVIAATTKDLQALVAAGAFRADLYAWFHDGQVFVPPLRERKCDLTTLVDHFLERSAARYGKIVKRISTPAIDALTSYHWPGNAAELQSVLDRAVLACEGQVVHEHHLPPTLQTPETSGTVAASLAAAVDAFERDLIQDALKTARGNRAAAARLLHTTERILNYRIKKLGIDPGRFKGPAARS